LSSDKHVQHEEVVWLGKPWVVPAAIVRTVTVFVVSVLFLWLEIYFGVAFSYLAGLAIFLPLSCMW
jgi:hypothetical protein